LRSRLARSSGFDFALLDQVDFPIGERFAIGTKHDLIGGRWRRRLHAVRLLALSVGRRARGRWRLVGARPRRFENLRDQRRLRGPGVGSDAQRLRDRKKLIFVLGFEH